jgi:hypothetical protein
MLGGERLAEPGRGWRLAQHQPAINGKRLAGQGSGIVASQHRDDSRGVARGERSRQRLVRGDISELLGRYDIGSRGWRQARSDSRHGDSVASESYRERACHADQSTLGRYIREHVCTGRTPIRIGHNKDHAAETAISHPGNEGLREQQRRLDIDRLDLTPHLKPEVVEWSEGDHRRRVNKNIASTVATKYRIRGRSYSARDGLGGCGRLTVVC